MAPKRKASGPGAGGPSAKRIASGVNTPVSLSSDDEYSDSGDAGDFSEHESAVPQKYDRT